MDPLSMFLISKGVDAAGGLLQTGANWIGQRIEQDYTNKLYKENWAMQNEYNKPANQVKRLREAGLSPALMYGSSANAGIASSIPSVSQVRPQFQGSGQDTMTSLLQYANLEQISAQTENLRATNEVLRAEAFLASRTAEVVTNIDDIIPKEVQYGLGKAWPVAKIAIQSAIAGRYRQKGKYQ